MVTSSPPPLLTGAEPDAVLGGKSEAKAPLPDPPNAEGVETVAAEDDALGAAPKMGLKFCRGLLSAAETVEELVTLNTGLKPGASREALAEGAGAGAAVAAGALNRLGAGGCTEVAVDGGAAEDEAEGAEVCRDRTGWTGAEAVTAAVTGDALFLFRDSRSRFVSGGTVLPGAVAGETPNAEPTVPEEAPRIPANVPEEAPRTPANVPEEAPRTPATVPEEAPRTPATVPAEVVGALVDELGATAEEAELVPSVPAVKVSPAVNGPVEELVMDGTLVAAGSGAGVSRSFWILLRAERFSSSRSSTVML